MLERDLVPCFTKDFLDPHVANEVLAKIKDRLSSGCRDLLDRRHRLDPPYGLAVARNQLRSLRERVQDSDRKPWLTAVLPRRPTVNLLSCIVFLAIIYLSQSDRTLCDRPSLVGDNLLHTPML